jgi:hypothetical protein
MVYPCGYRNASSCFHMYRPDVCGYANHCFYRKLQYTGLCARRNIRRYLQWFYTQYDWRGMGVSSRPIVLYSGVWNFSSRKWTVWSFNPASSVGVSEWLLKKAEIAERTCREKDRKAHNNPYRECMTDNKLAYSGFDRVGVWLDQSHSLR